MELFTVKFGENKKLGEFLNKEFINRGYVTDYNKNGDNYLSVTVEKNVFRSILATATVVFHKKHIVDKAFIKKDGALYSAFCGVIVGQDFDKEKYQIIRRIPDTSVISVNGIINFLLDDLEYSWRAFAFLANKLYDECVCQEDYFALIKYFLSGEILLSKTAVVQGGIYLDGENKKINVAEVFDNDSDNIAFNLMLIKPVEIVVPNPAEYPSDLITLIRRLGEG